MQENFYRRNRRIINQSAVGLMLFVAGYMAGRCHAAEVQYTDKPSIAEPTPKPDESVVPPERNDHIPVEIVPTDHDRTWPIQSVSSMKVTKDAICNPLEEEDIRQWVDRAVDLGANYVAVETPYENVSCHEGHEGDTLAYTKQWKHIIHDRGLGVWHRHMPVAAEGIYGVEKDPNKDYLSLIEQYLHENIDDFRSGDIFTPAPEPQNWGIEGINTCYHDVCIFKSKTGHWHAGDEFNQWLLQSMKVSRDVFDAYPHLAGKINVGYFGFDGYIGWGYNNPDWGCHDILYPETVRQMRVLAVDHYSRDMAGDLRELDACYPPEEYPELQIAVSEWGTIEGGDVAAGAQASLAAMAANPRIIAVQYWHGGGVDHTNEALWDRNFRPNPQYPIVQGYYRRSR